MRRLGSRTVVVALLAMAFATALSSPATSSSPTALEVIAGPQAGLDAAVATSALAVGNNGFSVGHADVLRLYWAFFDRDPDATGTSYWIDQFDAGLSVDAIAYAFSVSDEFELRYGSASDADFVRIVYRNVLGRDAEASGFAYWTELLTDSPATRVDVVRWISASSEFIAAHPFRAPDVQAQLDGDPPMAVAIDVVESLAAGRPTSHLPDDRTSDLEMAIHALQARYGRFSTVRPGPACGDGSSGATRCEIDIAEAGSGSRLTVTVDAGDVVAIGGVVPAGADGWAVDAIRTAVTGATVYGSQGLPAGDRTTVASTAARIGPTVGGVGKATVAQGLNCANSAIAPTTPGEGSKLRRACRAEVSGPLMSIIVEAVTHDGAFAGINVEIPRQYSEESYGPYATIGDVVLHQPAARVERIGYHQSGHDGARVQDPTPTQTVSMVLGDRGRDTGRRTAADIAVDPDSEIRAPVTGTVKRAGTYVLYCRYQDHYLVIEPDARPGYEVKVLHFEGLSVAKGERVVAGETVVGSKARILPFRSQIDAFTSEPSNPHIHIEVVDPTIPDRPSGGGC